jgi:hypothetical protein
MSKSPSRLEGGLIARKGEAVPATIVSPKTQSTTNDSDNAATVTQTRPAERSIPKGIAGTIAVTVRLDPDRYERLKIHGARQRQSNQQILVAALDAYL